MAGDEGEREVQMTVKDLKPNNEDDDGGKSETQREEKRLLAKDQNSG